MDAKKILLAFTGSINKYNEFEKQLNDLKAITGKDISNNEKIKDLVSWYRNEYVKRPEKYPGDHIVLKILRGHIAYGFSLNVAISNTYDELRGRLAIIDFKRNITRNSY